MLSCGIENGGINDVERQAKYFCVLFLLCGTLLRDTSMLENLAFNFLNYLCIVKEIHFRR
ncbi:hypothetical protein GCM10007140_33530 [Priestia taiwanensis]|uniref:Uncharacterized protein n=1 Tax=Priestia taiwanensis TaxID=1347902 RepID=A0A917ETT4_9BACI|nr:hypothetical protein GCM10007140_33530 [Priestia taiwanensis]